MKILYLSNVLEQTGYSNASRSLITALDQTGISLAVRNLPLTNTKYS